VTTTVHKTLGGPRSAVIFSRTEHAKVIDSNVFPGHQGGPLMHAIAAKAVAFKIAATPEFRARQEQTVSAAKILGKRLMRPDCEGNGINVLTGGTDVHLVLVDLRDSPMGGRDAEDALHRIGITVNRNAVPFDPRPPMTTSGLRIGTSALASRGFLAVDFGEAAQLVAATLSGTAEPAELAARVSALADAHPLYSSLAAHSTGGMLARSGHP
jgi:glycine hydroxymethyltransferase